jgi:hypothetical protein
MITAIQSAFDKVMEDLKDRWDFYRHAAFLKKTGMTEEQYQRNFDDDRNPRADRVDDYYFGYRHVYVFTSTRVPPFTLYPDWSRAYDAMTTWCQTNCQDKWRHDILRVSKKRLWHNTESGTMEASDSGEWIVDEMGGGDCLFFAFKDSKDYSMFLLRWS